MTREQIFEIWAPAGGAWSDWAKPIMFAQMPPSWGRHTEAPAIVEPDVNWAEALTPGTALIVDMPGEESVSLGLALARRGFRPVPLFNAAVAGTVDSPEAAAISPVNPPMAINVWPMMAALWHGTRMLSEATIDAQAPPAFLLDARRRMGERAPGAGVFDNRWMCFPTDFPSAARLKNAGIGRVVMMQHSSQVAADLAHVLLRWQEAGIPIAHAHAAGGLTELHVPRPRWYRMAWYTILAALGLRRSPLGGFGGQMSDGGGAG